jgi:DNA polymerase IV
MQNEQRIIAHIDMNSYFATCEQQDNPEWRGKPVGVCEHLGGIIIAPSIEAKKWGIKTAMPVWEARKLYPKIILTPTHPNRYRKYTARFLKVFEDYTADVEKYSIDEAFLDLTKACNIRRPNAQKILTKVDPWEEAEAIAREIKQRMQTEVGEWIKCSIGIGSNKLLAKIGSDFRKPDGLTVFRPEDKHIIYEQLKLTDIPGIGNRMKKRLRELGINTLTDLRDYPASKLVAKFGIMGYHFHQLGQLEGSWKEGFEEEEEQIKSIGHMYTLPKEYRKQNVLREVLYKLCEMVGARLRVNGLMGNVVSVYLHDHEYVGAGKMHKLDRYITDGREIYFEAMSALREVSGLGNDSSLKDKQKDFYDVAQKWEGKLYLIGITVAGLKPNTVQPSLFDRDQRQARVVDALDKINTKYEDFTMARTPAFLARHILRDSIGFGRMKEFKTSHVRGSRSRFQ